MQTIVAPREPPFELDPAKRRALVEWLQSHDPQAIDAYDWADVSRVAPLLGFDQPPETTPPE